MDTRGRVVGRAESGVAGRGMDDMFLLGFVYQSSHGGVWNGTEISGIKPCCARLMCVDQHVSKQPSPVFPLYSRIALLPLVCLSYYYLQDIRQHFVAYEAANHELGNKILAHVVPDA